MVPTAGAALATLAAAATAAATAAAALAAALAAAALPAASRVASAATSAASSAAASPANPATTSAFALSLAARQPQSTFETQPAAPPAEFLAGAAGASGCGVGVLPQSACMSAFHAAWVSDQGGEGEGRGEGGLETELAKARGRAMASPRPVTGVAGRPSSDAELARLPESAMAVCRSSGVSGRGNAPAKSVSGPGGHTASSWEMWMARASAASSSTCTRTRPRSRTSSSRSRSVTPCIASHTV